MRVILAWSSEFFLCFWVIKFPFFVNYRTIKKITQVFNIFICQQENYFLIQHFPLAIITSLKDFDWWLIIIDDCWATDSFYNYVITYHNSLNCVSFLLQSGVMSVTFAKFHPNLIVGGTYSGQIVLWDNRSSKKTPVQRTPLSATAHTVS